MEVNPAEKGILPDDEDVEMEEQLTLPILPDEIWLKIFGDLSNKKDLLNSTLVCKEWNDLISSSSAFLKKFDFKIDFSGESVVDDINGGRFEITRKYRELVIKGDRGVTRETYTKLLDIIKVLLGDHLVTLDLREIHISRLRLVDLIKLLSSCHVIENLYLYAVDLDETGNKNLEPAKLKQLKNLTLEYSETSEKMLDFIECTKLEKLFFRLMTSSGDSLIKFLNRLDQLDNLYVSYFRFKSKILLQPKFHWNELDLQRITLPPPSSPEYATAIANLEVLGSDLNAESSIMQIILNNCENIKELSFDDTNLSLNTPPQLRQMKEIYKLTVKSNGSVDRRLNEDYIYYDVRSLQRRSFNAIMEKMPNVKHLKLEGPGSMFMLGIELVPILFANVTLLDVNMHVLEEIQTYSFPILTTLAIDVVGRKRRRDFKMIATFSSANLNLKHLELEVRSKPVVSRMEADVFMLKLHSELCHTSFENFKILFNYSSFHWEKFGLIVDKTKEEIEMNFFGRVLTTNERCDYAM